MTGFIEASSASGHWGLVMCVTVLWVVVGLSGVFAKAGWEGGLCLVPLVNIVVLGQIAGWDGLQIAGLFVPGLNGFFWILLMIDLAHAFGRGTVFTLGMILMPMVFLPLLGLDDSRYLGPNTIFVAS